MGSVSIVLYSMLVLILIFGLLIVDDLRPIGAGTVIGLPICSSRGLALPAANRGIDVGLQTPV